MSSRRPIRPKEILNPDRILSNLLRDYVEGVFDDYNFLFRASVVKIDHVGGQLPSPSAPELPLNPKNSIQARVITNSRDKDLPDTDLPIFWPLFPHDVMPVKEGEHVYVIFEDSNNKSHGLWIARIPEPATVDSANLVPGVKKYQDDPDSDFSQIGAEQAVQDTDKAPSPVSVSEDFSVEAVPAFTARVGDRVIEGSNNAMIVLGRDRPSDKSSGQKENAGTVDIVVGRNKPEDMDLANDKARIYITSKSDIDDNLQITDGNNAKGASAIALKADQIRIVVNGDFKIVADGDVLIGKEATEAAVLGDTLKQIISSGPIATLGSIPLLAHPTFINKLATALSKSVKIKK